ncbi:MAG: flagellar basal body-associated FliL family protein [Spirochaetaceae bacterium]
MSDDQLFDTEEEVASDEGSGGRRVGFLPGILIQVLKWAGIIVGAIIFIVTVVIITLQFLSPGGTSQTAPPESEPYQAAPPVLSWWDQVGEIRGSTADEPRKTFIVEPFVGYEEENTAIRTELNSRRIEIREQIALYFSSKTSDDLVGVEGRQRAKDELTTRINEMMSRGKIDDVAFGRYEIIDF